MEIVALIFSGISAITAVFSTIAAFKAKKEVKEIKHSINNKINQQIEENNGNVIGINHGDINEQNKR